MKIAMHLTVLGAALASLGYLAAPARADRWDKQTILKFNEPVEVPGHVLIPGTYVFRLADFQADREVVRIFREDRNGMDHLVTTQFVAPAYREQVSPDPVVRFFEEPNQITPQAINKWYYPGDNYGWQFIYRRKQEQIAHGKTTLTARSGS